MQETDKIQETDSIDLSKVAALQQKRTLAFVNHFVITTTQFLNNFAKQCEQRLMHFERKLENINATMVLLEARLSSIPEVNSVGNTQISEQKEFVQNEPINNQIGEEPQTAVETNENYTSPSNEVKPEYERFVKMFQVGVPLDAVKLKVSLEGLDPKELDKILGK